MSTTVVVAAALVAAAVVAGPVQPARRLGHLRPPIPDAAPQPRHRRAGLLVLGGGFALWSVSAVAGAFAALAVGACAAGFAIGVAQLRRRHRLAVLEAAVVELCRAIAAELRAGRATGNAFVVAAQSSAAPLRAALHPAVAVGTRGDSVDLADVVVALAANPGLQGLRRMAACWRVAAASGAALAPAIDRIADALQDEIDLRRDVAAALAGPRSTVRLLASLPLLGLLLGTVIGANPLAFLGGSTTGVSCLATAIALDVTGVWWSARIAHRAAQIG